jgi:hypothetical protein
MVTNAEALEQVVLGEDRLATALAPSRLPTDMSTVGPDAVRSSLKKGALVIATVREAWRTAVPDLHDRHGPLPPLLVLLTVVTGLVDASSYLVLGHVFVANMTGNVVFAGCRPRPCSSAASPTRSSSGTASRRCPSCSPAGCSSPPAAAPGGSPGPVPVDPAPVRSPGHAGAGSSCPPRNQLV